MLVRSIPKGYVRPRGEIAAPLRSRRVEAAKWHGTERSLYRNRIAHYSALLPIDRRSAFRYGATNRADREKGRATLASRDSRLDRAAITVALR
jgi:hypothetical protein